MKSIFLFDMDGTLTPPRQKMPIDIEIMLKTIQESGSEVGIITGSDMNYIKQQCSNMFDLQLLRTQDVHFFPCNGTKYILNQELKYSYNMKEVLGLTTWRAFVAHLFQLQNYLIIDNLGRLPLTGTFFDYRGSMLNWCPIGRNANDEEREKWIALDKEKSIRERLLKNIKSYINRGSGMNLTAKLGGDTSFDIFPKGWDKTFPLEKMNLFNDYKIFFIGDRCKENGNDYEIFSHPQTTAFETHSTKQTIEIVNKILSSNV
tara:strand:- start:1428 stop:2207 length:780 start_codon:yes stop_codon:yes gene_type:complete